MNDKTDVAAVVGTVNRRRIPRPQDILVADDNEDVRQLWRACLTMSGYAVTEAFDGADAVAKASLNAPALILMDFSMPVMNGAEAVHRLRLNAPTRTIPVIGITAHSEATTRDFRRVCDSVLDKPVNPDDLLAAVRHALRGRITPPPGA